MRLRGAAILALSCACARPAVPAEPGAPSAAPAGSSAAQGSQGMNMLSKKVLRECSGDDAAVVLARVAGARISAPGTRSEAAILELEVERTICGTSPPAVSTWRYTSRGNTVLQQGRKYVVAFARGAGPVPYGLGDFVPVPEGREAEIVEAHLAVVKRMSPPGK
jgi:hypothetical protein